MGPRLPACLALTIASFVPAAYAPRLAAATRASAQASSQGASLDAIEREALELKSAGRYRESFEKFAELLTRATSTPELDDATSARAEFFAELLGNLASKVPDHEGVVTIFDRVAAQSAVERRPVLKARIEHLTAQHLVWAGRSQDAHKRIDDLGYVRDFAVLGPFDNERGSRFAHAYAPESAPAPEYDFDAAVQGKKRPLRWRRTKLDAIALATMDLSSRLRPREQCLAYLAFVVTSESARDVCLRFASTGSSAVFVHGSEVFRRDVQQRPLGFDQDVCTFRVRAGRTLVLLKTCAQSGPFAIRARLTTPEGAALEAQRLVDAELGTLREVFRDADKSFSARSQTEAASGAVAHMEARVRALQKAPAAGDELGMTAFRLAYLLALRAPDDESARRDREFARVASEALPDFGIAHYLRAYTLVRRGASNPDRDENARRQALEAAIAAWPRSAEAMRALASLDQETVETNARAERWLDRALSIHPQYVYACVDKLDLLAKLDFDHIYARTLEEYRAAPGLATHPAILDRAIDAARERRAHREELALLGQRLARSHDYATLLRTGRTLQTLGRFEDARALYERATREYPDARGGYTALAGLHASRADLDAACKVYQSWLEVCPEDAETHTRLARSYQRAGRPELERAELKTALELNPNLKNERRRLEWLEKGTATFYAGMTLDADAIREADPGPDADAAKAGDTHYYAFRHRVVRAYTNGTTSTYVHVLAKVLTEDGATTFDTYRTPSTGGNPSSRILEARVIRPDGSVQRARLGYTRFVDLPPIRVGDWVEIAARVDDRNPTFFGRYFGYTHLFPASERVPVRLSRLDLVLDAGREYVFQTVGDVPEARVRALPNGAQHHQWTLRDLPRRDAEVMAPSLLERGPLVRCSTYPNWDAFASWWWNLIRKQTAMTPEIRTKVRELVEGLPTVEAKVQRIYEFVISDIQYEAWEFGVHGYKPYSIGSIFARRFGDCKDKAILLNAMLGEVGVRAYPVLIQADVRRDEDDLTLPMVEHFNHCISYVPEQQGMPARFLDGTAQYHPLDNLPSMDRGAKVLVVEGEKGRVLDIPWTRADDNRDERSYDVTLASDGSAKLRYERRPRGEFGPRVRELYLNRGAERDKSLEDEVGRTFGRVRLVRSWYSALDKLEEPVVLGAEVEVPALAIRDGAGFRLPVVFGKERLGRLAPRDKRERDLILSTPSSRVRVITYRIPEGYRVAGVPASIDFDDEVGRVRLQVTQQERAVTLRYERAFRLARIDPERYAKFKELTEVSERIESLELRMEQAR